MALVLRRVYEFFSYYFNEFEDPRVIGYPLVGSPFPVIAIIVLYLFFVTKWGPALMKDRAPFDLKSFIRVYNIYQVFYNLYFSSYALWYSYLRSDFSFTCEPVNTKNTEPYMEKLIFAAYMYYISKYVDLLDTIIFILRKKNNQVTFLHVYHHGGIIGGVYCYIKFIAGSHATLLGVINGFVHVVMYGYYYLSSLDNNASKYAWCKKYITQIQLLQFAYLLIHFTIPVLKADCDYPMFVCMIGIVQNMFMFALFLDFYIKAYIKKKK